MKTGMFTRTLLASACSFAMISTAQAQTAETDTIEGDEILVTAQNRSENVNDVPIAIDVVGAEELKAAGFSSMNDITKIAPVVQLNQDQGTVKVTVRGIGTASNDEAQDTSVVINIDGEYINRPNVLGSALFDMERVEVLRGPQGTLYGRNSTGGAINFITRKPGDKFGMNATASYGNYNALRLDAGVDVPLGSAGGIRVAAFADERDGYVKHAARAAFGPFPAFAGGSSDDNDAWGVRGTLHLTPGALTVTLQGEYADRRFTPQAFAAKDLNAAGNGPTGPGCNLTGFVRVAPNYAETLCVPSGTNYLSTIDRTTYAAPNFGLGRVGNDTYAIRGRFSYEFSDALTLTYTGGIRSYSGDGDSKLTLPIVYRSYTFMDEADTQSHELRLNGVLGGVTYQIGSFYFKEKLDRESGFMLPIGANGTFLSYFGRFVESESRSLFGQVEVPLGAKLTAVGGLRYTDNDRVALYRNAGPFGPGAPDPLLLNAGPSRKNFSTLKFVSTLNLNPPKEDKVTWLAGLNFKPNDDSLIYAKMSTGFKAGGFDSVAAYKPETNTAIEAGLKQSFGGNGQHQLNLGAFHYNYKDLQVSVLLDTTIGGQTFNAGKAKIWGLEATGDIALGENTNFTASANYLNSEYKELFAQFNVFRVPGTGTTDRNGIGDLDPTAAGVQKPNFGGNRTPFSPKYIFNFGLDHKFELGNLGSLTLAANSTIKGSYFTDFFNYQDGKQGSFSQTDLSATFKSSNGQYTVQGFVRNLEKKRPLTYGSFVSAGPDDIFNWQFGAPRTYGVRVGVDF